MSLKIRLKSGENRRYIALIFLMSIFSLLRIYRNSIQYSSDQQGGIWNIMAALFVILGIVALFQNRTVSRGVFSTLLLYSTLIWVHEIIHFTGISTNNLYYLITAPYFVFVMYVFYHNYVEDKESVTWIIRFSFIIIFGMLIYSFLRLRRGTLDDLLLADVYYLLCLLPLLMMYEKNGLVKIAATIGTGLLIVISEKRAALIAYGLFVFIQYVIADKSIEGHKKLRRSIALIVVIIGTYFGYRYLLSTIGSRLLFRMSMLAETGGSGRARMYLAIWNAFRESNIIEKLFGHGRGTIALIPGVNHSAAHSDFLHILYVYGVIPFILFCLFYLQLFLEWRKMKKYAYPNASLYLGGFIICLMLSLFSTFCVSFGYVTCGAAFLGIILSDWNKYKNSREIIK